LAYAYVGSNPTSSTRAFWAISFDVKGQPVSKRKRGKSGARSCKGCRNNRNKKFSSGCRDIRNKKFSSAEVGIDEQRSVETEIQGLNSGIEFGRV